MVTGLGWQPTGCTQIQSVNSLHDITCHLVDAFIQSDLQLIRLSRRQSPPGAMWGEGPKALQILSWPGIWDQTTDLAGPSQVA